METNLNAKELLTVLKCQHLPHGHYCIIHQSCLIDDAALNHGVPISTIIKCERGVSMLLKQLVCSYPM